MNVKKYNGELQEFNVEKIRESIAKNSKGLDVDTLKLEQDIDVTFFDGISTHEIQKNLIYHAITLCEDIQSSDWRIVAGRMLLNDFNKTTEKTRGFGLSNIEQLILTNSGMYSKECVEIITHMHISLSNDDYAKVIDAIDYSRDMLYDYSGANMIITRYLKENETWQELLMILAILISNPMERGWNVDLIIEFYNAFSLKKLSLATPILSNLRMKGGNLASCFITKMDDSLESIFDTIGDIATISGKGGGVGLNMSSVRAKGSSIKGNEGMSSGVAPWIKIVNDTANAVNQGGVRCWHKDTTTVKKLSKVKINEEIYSIDNLPNNTSINLLIKDFKTQDMMRLDNNLEFMYDDASIGDINIDDYLLSRNINTHLNIPNRVNEVIPSTVNQAHTCKITLNGGKIFYTSINTKLFMKTLYKDNPLMGFTLIKDIISNKTKQLCMDSMYNKIEGNVQFKFSEIDDNRKYYWLNNNSEYIEIIDIEPNYKMDSKEFIDFNIDNDHNFYVGANDDPDFYLSHNSGAVSISLDIWHLDLEEFLELQLEVGDLRKKSFDFYPSVVIYDEFMNRMINNDDWYLFDPHEVSSVLGTRLEDHYGLAFEKLYNEAISLAKIGKIKNFKVINTRVIIKQILMNWLETGMPYIFFKDTVNKVNPDNKGIVYNANLCVESFSSFDSKVTHTCNLLSLNGATIKFKEIEYYTELGVLIMDNIIDITKYPIDSSELHNTLHRTIGIGMIGMADYMAKYDFKYDQLDVIDTLFEKIAYSAAKASINLAKDRGHYEYYKGSQWDTGEMIERYANQSTTRDMKEKWENLNYEIKECGIRNSLHLAVAPSSSTAIVQNVTPSVLPPFSKFYFEKNSKGNIAKCPPFIKDKQWFYTEYKNVDKLAMNSVIATIQRWVDTGISYETLWDINEDFSAVDLYNFIVDAWEKKIKTIYYTRTIQKNTDKESCVSCAN